MSQLSLLFLHGFPFQSGSWAPQLAHFSSRFATLAPNLRGHGDGPNGSGPWFIHHYVEDLRALLDGKGLGKVVICGLSMGGYVALHFAQKYPDRLRGLVLCDTRAEADSNEAKDQRFATLERMRKQGLLLFAQEFSRSVVSEETLREKPDVTQKLAAMITANKLDSLALALGALASRRDSTPFLKAIRCPSLVMVGERDRVTPVEANRTLAAGISGASFRVIPGAGHIANLERPGEFNAALDEFLHDKLAA